MNLTLVGLLGTFMLSKVQREPGSDETSWGECEEGCSSKPRFNTFPSDQKVQVKYLTSNKQEMEKATVAEYGFRPKGVAHLIGMFFFPAFWSNPVNSSKSLLMGSTPGLGTGVQQWGNHPGEIVWKSSEDLMCSRLLLAAEEPLCVHQLCRSLLTQWHHYSTSKKKKLLKTFSPSSRQLSLKMWTAKGWSLRLCLQKLHKKNPQTSIKYFTVRTIQEPGQLWERRKKKWCRIITCAHVCPPQPWSCVLLSPSPRHSSALTNPSVETERPWLLFTPSLILCSQSFLNIMLLKGWDWCPHASHTNNLEAIHIFAQSWLVFAISWND